MTGPMKLSRRAYWSSVVCVGLFGGVLPMTALSGGGNDFGKAYYAAARALLETGTFEYSYESVKNIPVVILAMVPFAALGRDLGEFCFVALNQIAYVAAFALVVRAFARSAIDCVVLALLFVVNDAIWVSIALGQMTPLTMFLLVCALVLLERQRSALSGAMLGLAFLLKIPAGLCGLLYLRRADVKAIAGAVTIGSAIVALSFAVFGVQLHRNYWTNVIVANVGGTLLAANNQNVFAFVTRYLFPPAFWDWSGVAIPALLRTSINLVVLGWLAFLFLRVLDATARDPRRVRFDFAVLLCTALVMFPVSWDHYYMFMILPFWCVYDALRERPSRLGSVMAICSFLLVNLPEDFRTSWWAYPPAVQITVVAAPFLGAMWVLAVMVWLKRRMPAARLEGDAYACEV